MHLIHLDRDFTGKTALLVSSWTNAPFVAILAFILINELQPGPFPLISTTVSVLFAGIFPTLIIFLWSKKVKKIAIDMPEKEDRHHPLILVIISYCIGTTVLFFSHSPWLVTGLMFCYWMNTLIVLFITLSWKISIHAMGIAGPATALFIGTGTPALFLAVLLPVVMWSRVRLHQHTVGQVVAGAGLGIALTGLELFIIRPFL